MDFESQRYQRKLPVSYPRQSDSTRSPESSALQETLKSSGSVLSLLRRKATKSDLKTFLQNDSSWRVDTTGPETSTPKPKRSRLKFDRAGNPGTKQEDNKTKKSRRKKTPNTGDEHDDHGLSDHIMPVLSLPSFEANQPPAQHPPTELQLGTHYPFTKSMWSIIPLSILHLDLDLFIPGMTSEPTAGDALLPEDLGPLTKLHHLRSLTLRGMMDSYQEYIWQMAWLCPYLENLTLEMGLEPRLEDMVTENWPAIDHKWRSQQFDDVARDYYGDDGQGCIHLDFGEGEYLDTKAIANARKSAMTKGLVNEKLTIVQLKLAGFVVDANPFEDWFDGTKLRSVVFMADCFDSGFGLSSTFSQTKVYYPHNDMRHNDVTHATITKFPAGSVRVVDYGKRNEKVVGLRDKNFHPIRSPQSEQVFAQSSNWGRAQSARIARMEWELQEDLRTEQGIGESQVDFGFS